MHDVHVDRRRTALDHVVQGRQDDGGPGPAGRFAAGLGQQDRLRHVSVSGAQGRRGDGAGRGYRDPGR